MINSSASVTLAAWGLAALAAPLSAASAAERAGEDAANRMEVICLTDQPAIVQGETATLRAWASTPDGRPIDEPVVFAWEVKEGHIETQAAHARWDLSAVKIEAREGAKKVIATVTATEASRGDARCKVEVFIGKTESVLPDRGTLRSQDLLSAKRYLLPDLPEGGGYGLYSYLLFSAPPHSPEQTARYLKTIEAYLLVIQDVDELRKHVRPSRLNATFIPLKEPPALGKSNAEWAANVLAHYDYAAAQILLASLGRPYRNGPYLVSVLKPLSQVSQGAHQLEDLTGMVPDLAHDWVQLFTYLAAQERGWTEESLQRLGLKLRNLVAVGGKVTPEMLHGLGKMIVFTRGK